jgi:hypothetical protein
MRRILLVVLATLALLLGSIGAVVAAPSENANCVAPLFMAFAPGRPGLSEPAQEDGLGEEVGGRGDGSAPTNSCT